MTLSLFLPGSCFYLKPNCNIKIQKPYRKLLFANSKRSRKWEANPCDFERTWCYTILQCHISLKEPYKPYTSRISYRVWPKLMLFSGDGGGRLFEGGRLLQILSLKRGANLKLICMKMALKAEQIYKWMVSHELGNGLLQACTSRVNTSVRKVGCRCCCFQTIYGASQSRGLVVGFQRAYM